MTGPEARPGLAGEPSSMAGALISGSSSCGLLLDGGHRAGLDDVDVAVFLGPFDILRHAVVVFDVHRQFGQLDDFFVGYFLLFLLGGGHCCQ